MISIIQIKKLEVSDLENLTAESLGEGFGFVERLRDEWDSGVNRFSAPGEALFLAILGGRVVGVCGLNRDPYVREHHIGRVRRLYVAQSHRRQGVGRALLEAVLTYARPHFR